MKSLCLLVLCAIILQLSERGLARYQWTCSEPDENGDRYIPSVRDYASNVFTTTTVGNEISIYRVQNVNTECYGEVTAIEFCYQYSTTQTGEAVFNWTVLILEEGNVFTITKIYAIESRPNSLSEGACEDIGAGKAECCDREYISSFIFQTNNFAFGVTESAQGNTHGATLLGFFDNELAQPQYIVDIVLISKTGRTISVGSTLPRIGVVQRGLRMLWFVFGAASIPTDTTSSPQVIDRNTTSPPIVEHDTTSSSSDHDTMSSENPESDQGLKTLSVSTTATGDSVVSTLPGALDITPYAVGGAVGGLLFVTAVVLVVGIVCFFVKRSQKKSPNRVNYKNVGLPSYDNAVYGFADGSNGTLSTKCTAPNLTVPASGERENFSTVVYDYITEQAKVEALPQEYTLPISSKNVGLRPIIPPAQKANENMYKSVYEAVPVIPPSRDDVYADEDTYMVPATDERSLYIQLSQIRISHFARDSVKLMKRLGSGQFGQVHRGEWTMPQVESKVDVAVKTLKEGAGEEEKVKFLQEAAIMGQFSHPNVVKLYGVIIEEDSVMLVIELLPKGDLRQVLRRVRSQFNSKLCINADLPHTLLGYCHQVASGMSYLASKAFIHRDLAARNILVSKDGVCKIADFGMSRDLEDTNYYISHGGVIPVKWTAPEALYYKKYSTASDVWSFGCIMYEIWSLGHKPFEDCTNMKCVQLVNKGIRLAPPPGCPRELYRLMIDCWHPDSSGRPDFVSVVQQLSLPDTKLLKWSEEDKATDPEAATLGAGLDKTVNLYKGLQEQYRSSYH